MTHTLLLTDVVDSTKLQLAALPARKDVPALDEVDPDLFRDAVLEAWKNRPIEERREALEQVLDRVTLDEGGVQIAYSMGADYGGVPSGRAYGHGCDGEWRWRCS